MSPSMPRLRVFISWAGKQAEAVGKGFHEFLPDAVNAIDLFVSGTDIDKGSRWGRDKFSTFIQSMLRPPVGNRQQDPDTW